MTADTNWYKECTQSRIKLLIYPITEITLPITYTCIYLFTDVPTDDEDDPDADPEYNVLAEGEPEVDEDDHILPVRVTSK